MSLGNRKLFLEERSMTDPDRNSQTIYSLTGSIFWQINILKKEDDCEIKQNHADHYVRIWEKACCLKEIGYTYGNVS